MDGVIEEDVPQHPDLRHGADDLIAAAAVALPLLLLLMRLFVSEVGQERAEARDAALRIARAAAAQMQALHNDSTALLDRIAGRPSVRSFDGASCETLFAVVDYDPQD